MKLTLLLTIVLFIGLVAGCDSTTQRSYNNPDNQQFAVSIRINDQSSREFMDVIRGDAVVYPRIPQGQPVYVNDYLFKDEQITLTVVLYDTDSSGYPINRIQYDSVRFNWRHPNYTLDIFDNHLERYP